MCRIREGKLGCELRPVYYLGQCNAGPCREKGVHKACIFGSVKTFSVNEQHTLNPLYVHALVALQLLREKAV